METKITNHGLYVSDDLMGAATLAAQLRKNGRQFTLSADDRTQFYLIERALENDPTPLITVDYDG